jgi:Protein of unknown function (DUF1559)
MSTDQRPCIPRSAWACFAAGWLTVGLMVLICLGSLDLITLPLPNAFGVLLIAAAGITIVSGVWSMYTVERGPNQQRGRRLAAWGMLLPTFVFCGASFVVPACQMTTLSATRLLTQDRLKQISLALHAYHNQQGHLPPAALRSADGKPLLSWRVAILPYLNQIDLYKRFHLDEPWDSPHNLALLPEMPPAFRMPPDNRSPADMTFYHVIVGPGTAFERDRLRLPEDFPDGLPTTILVAEAAAPVPWTQPADLTFDPAGSLPKFGADIPAIRFRGRLGGLFFVITADGEVRQIPSLSPSTLRAIITRNGGEKLPADWNG